MLRKLRNKIYKKGNRLATRVCPEIVDLVNGQKILHAANESHIKNLTTLLEGAQQIAETVRHIERQSEELAHLRARMDQLTRKVEAIPGRTKMLPTTDFSKLNPEAGLLAYLYSFLPSRKAIDVGAHHGNISEALLDAGYEVFAFEPNPAVFTKLEERCAKRKGFHAFNVAVGAAPGRAKLHLAKFKSSYVPAASQDPTLYSSLAEHSMPGELSFHDSISVEVTDLASWHEKGKLPADIAVLKTDTEGFELEVIKGMGEQRYPVVMAEFWDAKIPFGAVNAHNHLEDMVPEMKKRGYHWYMVIYRFWTSDSPAYYCNYPRAVENSWGNVFFFHDHSVFAEAQKWAAATLPLTHFVSS